MDLRYKKKETQVLDILNGDANLLNFSPSKKTEYRQETRVE